MEEVQYKRAGQADIPMLVDQRIIFATALGGPIPAASEEDMRAQNTAYFEQQLNKNYIAWYVEMGVEVISIACMHLRNLPGTVSNLGGKWGYVMNVYTAPGHRRKGYSTRLLELLIQTATAEYGVLAFELHATASGAPVYIKSGFAIHPEPTFRRFVSV